MWNWLSKFAESGAPPWVLLIVVIIVAVCGVVKASLKMSAEQIDARTRRWLAKQWVRRSRSQWTYLKRRLLGGHHDSERD